MFKDPGAESSSVYYYRQGSAASRMEPGFLTTAQLQGVRIVHTTGITPALSASCREMVDRLFIDARAAGALVSFDVNDRRPLWSTQEAAETLARLADAADITFVGPRRGRTHLGHGDAGRDPRVPPELRAAGRQGRRRRRHRLRRRRRTVFVPAPVVDVVEPVGAGDAFASGFLAATLEGADLAARLSAGHAAAGRVLTIAADLPPLVTLS